MPVYSNLLHKHTHLSLKLIIKTCYCMNSQSVHVPSVGTHLQCVHYSGLFWLSVTSAWPCISLMTQENCIFKIFLIIGIRPYIEISTLESFNLYELVKWQDSVVTQISLYTISCLWVYSHLYKIKRQSLTHWFKCERIPTMRTNTCLMIWCTPWRSLVNN